MKSVEQILNETILDDEIRIFAVTNFKNNKFISTHDEGAYEDVKEALLQEGYTIKQTCYRNGLYHIYV